MIITYLFWQALNIKMRMIKKILNSQSNDEKLNLFDTEEYCCHVWGYSNERGVELMLVWWSETFGLETNASIYVQYI